MPDMLSAKPFFRVCLALLVCRLTLAHASAKRHTPPPADFRSTSVDTAQISTTPATLPLTSSRLEGYRRTWSRAMPSYAKAQVYGGMGLISIGGGWMYGRRNRVSTDVLLGFIPRYSREHADVALSVRENYFPWDIRLGSSAFRVAPFSMGCYLTTIFNNSYWTRLPEKYPSGYYWFSTRLRASLYLGGAVSYDLPTLRSLTRTLMLYYELSTSDFYLVSRATNHTLRPRDYLFLSFGVRLTFFEPARR